MPPKSRKVAAKKPSPRAKKATPATPSTLLAIAEERTENTAAEISAAAVVKEEAKAAEEEIAPVAAADAEKVPESKAEEEAPEEAGDDKIGEDPVAGKIAEETTVERIENETVVEEVVTKKVLDSVETLMEAADNESFPEAFGEGKGPDADETEPMEAAGKESVTEPSGEDKEGDGDGNEMETEEKDGEPEEEDPEEEEGEESENPEEEEGEESENEEEPGEEGDKHIVEEGAREGEVESISGDDEENEEDDSAMYVQAPLTKRKKQKEFEIFIGGLDKGAVEQDLIKVFGLFGEIQSVRIVKHPLTQKSKGFAFIRYASTEHAKKALAELKDGTEVKGKKVRISVSQDNDTLYLGNICKTWNRDQVLEAIKGYGIEEIEDVLLPEDPSSEGKIKGFAFLEFKSHNDAIAAFQRLRKPDAVFGCNVSAKVSFAQALLHPCEEDLLKVKTVYMEGIPMSWNEAKVEELCKQYGEIQKIQLSRNFTSTKRKDFGFVEFSSRDSAVACVEGINSVQLGEDVNLKANLAKPLYKGRLAKQSRGGYKVQKDGEVTEEAVKSKKKKKSKSKAVHDEKETQPNLKSLNKNTPSKSQDKNLKEKKGSQTVQSAKGKKRGWKSMGTAANQQTSKKARNNYNYGRGHGRYSTGYSDPRSSYSSNPYMPHQIAYAPSAPRYTAHAYPGASGSQLRRTDLEPHAGYLPAAKPVRNPYEYEGRRDGAYDFQPRSRSGYLGAPTAQSSYPGYPSYAGYEAGYSHPSSGAYAYRRTYY